MSGNNFEKTNTKQNFDYWQKNQNDKKTVTNNIIWDICK